MLLCLSDFQNGVTYFTMPNFGLGYILLNAKLDYETLFENSATQFSVEVVARVSNRFLLQYTICLYFEEL